MMIKKITIKSEAFLNWGLHLNIGENVEIVGFKKIESLRILANDFDSNINLGEKICLKYVGQEISLDQVLTIGKLTESMAGDIRIYAVDSASIYYSFLFCDVKTIEFVEEPTMLKEKEDGPLPF